MKKMSFILSGVAAATLILAGCGATEDNAQKEPVEVEKPVDNATQPEEKPENQIEYVKDEESVTEEATLTESDNQPFSIQVLPNFELSAEEPGKDTLYLSENTEIFTRIELLPADVNFDDIEANIQAQLSSISEDIIDPALNIDEGSNYEVRTEDGDVVTAVLLKSTSAPVRLTMFTTEDQDYRDAFLEMAKTIQAK